MSHITGFGINNFRVFGKQTIFNFAPITVFTGTNNSGKSSVIKGLCFLNENLEDKKIFDLLNKNKSSNLGQFDSILNNINKGQMSFLFPIPWKTKLVEGEQDWLLDLQFIKDKKSKENVGKLKRIRFLENKSGTVLFDLDIIGQKVETEESHNYTLGIPVYTFIQSLNVSLILNRIQETEHNPSQELSVNFDVEDVEFYSTKKPVGSKGMWVSKEWRAQWSEISPDFELSYEKVLSFPEMLEKLTGSDNQLVRYHSFKSSNFRFLKFDQQELLMLKYKAKENIEMPIKELCEIENLAFSNISNGICGFLHDLEFIEGISRHDCFNFFSYNNIDKSGDFIPLLTRTYSTFKGHSGEIAPGSLFIFELLVYEVIYLLLKTELYKKVMIDLELYRKLETDCTGASNISMYNRNENRGKYLSNNNIYHLEQFFKKLSGEIFSYVSDALSFTFISSTRNTGARIVNKDDNMTSFSGIITDFLKQESLSEIHQTFINYWLKEFNIGEQLIIENVEGIANAVYILKKGKKINITDFGIGTNRIIPLLLKIVSSGDIGELLPDEEGKRQTGPNAKSFIIEEPESNLHPALQSKFADLLIDAAYKFNIQFIIETHSEYLIRKLQYWTAKKVIKPEDTVIYYLNDPLTLKKGEEQVRTINILADGSLSGEFGQGFFDEAINLKLDILKLKNAQNN